MLEKAELRETIRFVNMFDKFFDSLNVSNFTSAKKERKVFKNPYRSGKDFRLEVDRLSTIHKIANIIIVFGERILTIFGCMGRFRV